MCRTLTFWDTKFRFCEGKTWRFNKRTKKWKCVDNKKPDGNGYILLKLTNNESKVKTLKLHRLVYKAYYPEWNIHDSSMNNYMDHIDRNKLNNHIDNLRVVTQQENSFNTKSNGFYFVKHIDKWCAHIQKNKKRTILGYYDTKEEARSARMKAKPIHHVIINRKMI